MVNETLESNHTSLYIWCKSVENTNAKQGREEQVTNCNLVPFYLYSDQFQSQSYFHSIFISSLNKTAFLSYTNIYPYIYRNNGSKKTIIQLNLNRISVYSEWRRISKRLLKFSKQQPYLCSFSGHRNHQLKTLLLHPLDVFVQDLSSPFMDL